MIVILSVCDLGQGVFFVVGHGEGDWCMAESLFGIFFASSSFLWTLVIAIFIFRTTASSAHPSLVFPSWMMALSHVVCWGYPAGFVMFISLWKPTLIGKESWDPWCFMRDGYPAARFFAVFFPLFVSWVGTGVLHLLTRRRIVSFEEIRRDLPQHLRGPQDGEIREIKDKLVYVPLAFVILRVWGAAYRIVEMFSASQHITNRHLSFLELAAAVGDPLQGFANFILFVVLTRKARASYASMVRGWFNPKTRADSNENSSLLIAS